MRIMALAAGLLVLAACGDREQAAREEAAEREDKIVSAQTGQQYGDDGPREEAAEELGDAYVPTTDAVASNPNSPVEADLPADVPEAKSEQPQ